MSFYILSRLEGDAVFLDFGVSYYNNFERSLLMDSSKYMRDIQINLSKMPATYVEDPYGCNGIFFIFFGLLVGVFPSLDLMNSTYRGKFEPEMLGLLLFTTVSLLIILHGIKILTGKKVIKFDKDRVEYSESSVFGKKVWSEKLANYMGVGSRIQYRSSSKNRPSYTLYIIEMLHQDKTKNICLYQSQSSALFRKIWEKYCRQLKMTAIEGEGEDAVFRDVEDLDKSVAELAAEGKVEIKFDPTAQPPSGFKVKVEQKGLKIILPKKPTSLVGTAIGISIACFLIYFGLFSTKTRFIPALIGLLLGSITIGMAYWNRVIQNVVVLSDEKVRSYCDTPRGILSDITVRANQIETIRIGKKTGNSGPIGLLLITDHQTNILGEGLPRPALEWLKNCVLAVVTRKTEA